MDAPSPSSGTSSRESSSRERPLRLSSIGLLVLLFAIPSEGLPSECQHAVDAGTCERALFRYYYDAVTEDCERFIYTGCGGNDNRFIRRSQCREKCTAGRTPTTRATTTTRQSVLARRETTTAPEILVPMFGTTAVQCRGCDPLFGVCLHDGTCGCKQGYKKQGRICVDLDECEVSDVCPPDASCINTLGGFTCNCGPDKTCAPQRDPYELLTPPPPPSTNPPFIYTPPSRTESHSEEHAETIDASACAEPFDMKINENCGVMLPRYYYEELTKECRAVLYGGCTLTSKNIFKNRHECESICLKKTAHPSHHGHRPTATARKHVDSTKMELALPSFRSVNPAGSPETTTTPPPPPTTTTRFPPLPWEVEATTTSVDPYGLLKTTAKPQMPAVEELPKAVEDVPQPPPKAAEADSPQPPPSSSSPSSPCLAPFDGVLRQECMTSAWAERFYYDRDAEACVPFWYDTSCPAEERAGKNYFETMKECQRCLNAFDPKKDIPEVTPPPSSIRKESISFTSRPPFPRSGEEVEEVWRRKPEIDENEIQPEKAQTEESLVEVTTPPIPSTSSTTEKPSTSTTPPSTTISPEEERKRTEDAYLTIKNSGACSGILDPRLEDDCNNGDWQTRWYFSSDKGKCRPFWHGGCDVDIDNFYSSEVSCKLACGNKYKEEGGASFLPQSFPRDALNTPKAEEQFTLPPLPPREEENVEQPSWTTNFAPIDVVLTEAPPMTTTEHVPTIEEDEEAVRTLPPHNVYPIENTIRSRGSSFFTPRPSTTTTTAVPHPAEEAEVEESFSPDAQPETPPPIPAGGAGDPCDDPIDTKLEEECSADWEARAFFDQAKQKCVKFWYGGCAIASRNLFLDVQACRAVCAHKLPTAPGELAVSTPPPPPSSTSATPLLPTPAPLRTSSSSSSSFPSSSSESSTLTPPTHPTASDEGPSTTEQEQEEPAGSASLSSEPEAPKAEDAGVEGFHAVQDLGIPEDTSPPAQMTSSSHLDDDIPQPPPYPVFGEPPTTTTTTPPNSTTKKRTTITLRGFTASFYDRVEAPEGHKEKEEEPEIGAMTQKLEDPSETTTSGQATTAALTSSTAHFEWPWQCMAEHRRDAPARECGKDGKNWTQRYYFDHASRSCRMFWGCDLGEKSGNNFPDLLTCQWKCEPERATPNTRSCLDPLDPTLEDDCNGGKFVTKFHFDFATKKCVSFHYGGCRSPSTNVFDGAEHCKTTCERPDHTVAQSCMESFDRGFLNTCNVNGRFEPKYFYDGVKGKCEMFWWGGCRRSASNFFASLETCKWSCERPKKADGPQQCQDRFDKKLSESCEDGKWRERFFFDHESGKCSPFWWDGCYSESANFFRDQESCTELCEHAANADIGESHTLKEEFRCLEPKKVGECRETYPAYYYDRSHRECRPFSYSGCGGNGNRFLTLSQCDTLCKPFTALSESESACFLPLDTGHSEGECGKEAQISWHYDRAKGACAEFWFRGCGGNDNRFNSKSACSHVCSTRRPGPPPIRKTRSTHGV